MPLGDSITYGDTFTNNHTPIPGGYRTRLFQELEANGWRVEFVGSSAENPSPELRSAGAVHHEGHPGWTIQDIADHIDAWMGASHPDVVCLMIGTNDLARNADLPNIGYRLETLVDKIRKDAPDAYILVSSVVPFPNDASLDAKGVKYDREIWQIVHDRAGADARLVYVDQRVNFVDASRQVIKERVSDGVHPDRVGYDKMGGTWAQAILKLRLPK